MNEQEQLERGQMVEAYPTAMLDRRPRRKTTRLRWPRAAAIAEQLTEALLADVCERIETAGSIRRREPMVGDVELLCIARHAPDLFGDAGESLLESRVDRLLNDGRLAGRTRNGAKWKTLEVQHADRFVNVDLFITTPDEWGVALAIRTGPAAFSRRLVTSIDNGGLLASGLCIHGNRIWHGRTFTAAGQVDWPGEPLPTPEEPDVFQHLSCGWLEPESRSAHQGCPSATRPRNSQQFNGAAR